MKTSTGSLCSIALTLVSALFLVACDDKGKQEGADESAPAQAPAQSAPADTTPQEVQLTRAVYKPHAASLATTADVIAEGKSKKPNILVIMGDDIGYWNTSAYNRGMMGYETPNIDRIANEGMLFTDGYGEQSCTAGRSAFITGQSPFRTGLSKVGLPGADLGLRPEDPTIAELLKPLGYKTGQFGKNHLGDKDEFLPTKHGFDEFFGNLYHLNAEEEPENPDYPKDPAFKARFGPRGVIHSKADGKIEDTGPLNKKRMETIDEETVQAAVKFIEESHKEGKPFFTWYNSTRMHIFTHLKKESQGVTGLGIEADGMVEHDKTVKVLLDKLDELKIADNTIVVYTTDNGAETMSWPDGGMTPFKNEKATTWEGGMRVPMMVRWPKKVPAGVVSNGMISNMDWLPTFTAAAGEPDVVAKAKKGYAAGGKTFKVHLDGVNQLDLLLGNGGSARKEFFYFNDDGLLCAFRDERFKFHFSVQDGEGFAVWQKAFTPLRTPLIIDIKGDPFEKAPFVGIDYHHWLAEHMFLFVPAQAAVARFVTTFKDFPPRQKAASFSVDQVLAALSTNAK